MKNKNATDRVLRGGSLLRVEEYEIRSIDEHGDCIDVQHGRTVAEVRMYARLGGECVALVVERHVSYHPAHLTPRGREPDEYETVHVEGDESALRAGGWI